MVGLFAFADWDLRFEEPYQNADTMRILMERLEA